MKLMIAGLENGDGYKHLDVVMKSKYVLSSYYYLKTRRNDKIFMDWIKELNAKNNFVLDSGAFTFMTSRKVGHNEVNEYLEEYIDFINENNINQFIEMDIDSVFGYSQIKEWRKRIERATNKQVIPAWHKSRGIDDYKQTIKEYKYVAWGVFNKGEYFEKDYPFLKNLLKQTNLRGNQVHALGFTPITLKEWGFHSADSTNWSSGVRFGRLAVFDNGKIITTGGDKNQRIDIQKRGKAIRRNLQEWIKYQEYMERW